MNDKNTIVYYHADCTDGYGAAFAAWVKFGDSAEYVPCYYGDEIHPEDWIERISGRDVHIVDFSFPRPVMELTFEHAQHVTWLDHHKTAFEMWCPVERNYFVSMSERHVIILDNNQSGALIAWGRYNPSCDTPFIIKCIDDRDRWQFCIEQSRALHAGLQAARPWTFDQWLGFTHLVHNGGASGLVSNGRVLLANNERQVRDMLKQTRSCEITVDGESYPGLALNAPLHMSEIGNELAQESGSYGLVWYMGENGKAKCSLRSIGDYDVSAIAKKFGGGGHRNAAGFEVPMSKLLEWLL